MVKLFKIVFFLIIIFKSNYHFAQTNTEDDAPKKKEEYKITEVISPPDSVPASELLNRAVNWVKIESAKYGKTNGITTGSKAECIATFTVKPKELNPDCDYTGKITMKVIIECKDKRYKYTITQIKHISKSGKSNGGNFENIIAECGSMIMGDLIWKKLKGEAIKCANSIVSEIKINMLKPSIDAGKDNW